MTETEPSVLVTGASSGIGAATARAFGRRGDHVVLVARSADRLAAVAKDVEAAGGTATVVPADLTDDEAVVAMARTVRARVGTPDVVVNLAGAGRFLATEETTVAEARAMLELPAVAAFAVTRAFVREMIARGSGHVVNVTSAAAYVPWPGATAYATARWAMRGFSNALRADLAGTGVAVTLVATTEVDSPYWQHNPGSRERVPAIGRLFPLLTPATVADAIVDGVANRTKTVLVPTRLRYLLFVHRLWPGLLEWAVVKTGWKRER